MPRTAKNIEQSEKDAVINSIEDCIFESHRLCSIEELANISGLPTHRCRNILELLVSEKIISIAYEGRGKPTLYIPTYMFQEILRTQPKPRWVDKYAFTEKMDKIKQFKKARKDIVHYEMIETLLYGTDIPLQESVAHSLKYLGFEEVEHHQESDLQDVSFSHEGKKYLLEIEGTTKQGKKDKVSQLRGWIEKEVDAGTKPSKVVGIFVINPFRNRNPEEREDPLTRHAKSYLKLYHFRFFTTFFLFNIVKKISVGSLTKEKAREIIIEGEKHA